MLLGQFIQKVASKNRIALPARFRQELGDDLIISQGFEGSLLILSKKNWQKLVAKAVGGEFTTKEVRDIARFLLAGAVEIELDNQGRFVLPQPLKDFAHIKQTAIFLGLLNWVELWDFQRWQAYRQDLVKVSAEIAQKLKDLK